MNKTAYYIAMGTIFFGIITILFVTFLLVYPYKVIEFQKVDITKQKTVKSGGYLQVTQNYCKYMNLPAEVSRSFVDNVIYQVPVFTTNRKIGCNSSIEYIYVPKALPAGKYYIETIYRYQVNPLRKIEIKAKTSTFEIIK